MLLMQMNKNLKKKIFSLNVHTNSQYVLPVQTKMAAYYASSLQSDSSRKGEGDSE